MKVEKLNNSVILITPFGHAFQINVKFCVFDTLFEFQEIDSFLPFFVNLLAEYVEKWLKKKKLFKH